MRLAFSTLGCPELDLAGAIGLAAQGNWSGLELRSGPGLTVDPTWSTRRRTQARRQLEDAGIVPVSISSYLRLCDFSLDATQFRAAAQQQVGLARDLGARWLRVFPGGSMGAADSADDALGRARLRGLSSLARGAGVHVAVETHDSHPRVRDLQRLGPQSIADVGVIWDVLHPWRCGESPRQSVDMLASQAASTPVAVVQVKDVAAPIGTLAPVPLGQGVVPLRECLARVRERHLTEWISWEYERAWHPQSAPLSGLLEAAAAFLTGAEATDADAG